MTSGVKLQKMGPFEFNPRGNLWYRDESTFGRKLLSKMGWSKGKGLGKNEDGIKENIKIAKKDTNTGVGWKNDVHISVGCTEYENILNKLQRYNTKKTEVEDSKELKSLEQRSLNSRNHLHYSKFVKAKDLYQRSEKDMKCIFLENPQDWVNNSSEVEVKETSTFESKLSVNDYFAMKMQKRFGTVPKNDLNKDSEVEKPENPSFSDQQSTKKRKRNSKLSKKLKRIKLESELSASVNDMEAVKDSDINVKPTTDINETKTKKSKKNGLHKMKKLKSCIRTTSMFDLNKDRKVSFNDHVSYKILKSDTENVSDDSVENQNSISLNTDSEVPSDCMEHNDLPENKSSAISDAETDDKCQPECFNIPKCSASNFNFWLESQRAAMKMKMYRGMIDLMKKHDVLRTTNLLDIKGYGNWGD